MLKTTEIWIMFLLDDKEFIIESKFLIPLCIAGEKKENENMGLDFPISIENWLTLSTTALVIHIIFCILSVWLCFVVVAVFCLFSFFQCSSFSVSSSVFFFRCSMFFFFPFILVILLFIF